MRYFVHFSYDGKAYHGWQRQPNAITVQEVLEDAMGTLLRESLSLTAAGRTDAGVHAKEMFAHFDSDTFGQFDNIAYRINALLPDDISIFRIFSVADEAHARFSAIERSYEYRITTIKDPFLKDHALWVNQELDVNAMNESAAFLLDHTDFECFSRSKTDVKTFNCDVRHACWEQQDHQLVFHISADRFLRNMVRAIVGTLLQVGQGKMAPADVNAIIKSRDRSEAGASVAAKGLYLTRVVYPDELRVHSMKDHSNSTI